MTDTRSLVRAEIARITERFEAADARLKRAQAMSDPDQAKAAEDEKREAAADFWAAADGLADLFLLMLRYAAEHRPEQLCQALAGGMRAELYPIAEAVARLEKRK
jgi:hypothetical protein